jgi:hypothetical protein
MKTKEKSKIETIREQYAKNTEALVKKFSKDIYWDVFLDVGLAFLESLYGKNTKWYCEFRNDEQYWNWFYNEFKLNERALLNTKMLYEIDLFDYKANCLQLIAFDETGDSFYHSYLKAIKTKKR